jgi:hypothetical protein
VISAALVVSVLLAQSPSVTFAPPAVPADVEARLRAARVRWRPFPVRPTRLGQVAICAAPGGVVVTRGATGIQYRRPARVNGAFALRLLRFEAIVQEEALSAFRRRVTAIEHLGTYVCRMMAEYPDWVSEHSFGNAIDVATFVLAGGRRITVQRDWPPRQQDPTPAGQFLQRLGRRLYDEAVFSVVLTPNFDRRHHNHFHLDGATYRVDGN